MNKELNIGDYVRTKDGYINKTIKDDGCCMIVNALNFLGEGLHIAKSEIKKSSPNIIDLIEVGDYVNGYRVCELIEKGGLGYYESSLGTREKKTKEKSICLNNNYVMKFTNREIENVVTKEQIESMKYKIGE